MVRALLERDAQILVLEGRLAEAATGAGGMVLIDGPAGIGKSSLLGRARAAAAGSGFRILRAAGSPLEQHAGWGIVRQLFAPILGTADWDELAVGTAAFARGALEPAGTEPPVAADAAQAAALGLTWLACGLADRRPTLLCIDDVHWADPPSLRWLVQVAPHLPDHALAVTCAIRSGEPPAEPALLADLLLAASGPVLRPPPLGAAAAAAIIRTRVPEAGDRFGQACHAVTGGNPFLLEALADSLADGHLEPTDALAARLDTFGPDQVGRHVDQLLGRLPSGARELALAFAVLGRNAPLRRAGALAGLSAFEAVRVGDALQAAGVLSFDDGRYSFAHPLVAAALYRRLPAGERGLRHRLAARLLAEEHADPEAIALHLLRTEPYGDPATVEQLRRAAALALGRGAPASAAVLLRRALIEPPSGMVSADVREELGLALAADLHPDAPAMLTDAVEAAEEPAQRTRIALSAARAAGLQGNFDLAISLCRTGLQDQGATTTDHGTTALEVELAVLSTLNAATADEAARLIGRHAGDAPVLELWRIVGALLAATRGDPGPSDRGVLRAAVLGDVLEREPGTLLMTAVKVALIGCGDLELVDELCTRQIGAARSRGWVIALAHAGFLRAIVRVQTGRIRDAEADARQSFEYKLPVVPPPAIYWSLAPLVDALVELDAPADAEAALASVAHYGEPAAGAWSSAMVLESRARLHGAQGRPADALADAERAGSTWSAVGIANPALAAWRVTAAEALLRLGDRASAARRAAEHLALARQLGAPGPLIAGLRVSALAAGGADEIALLEEAVVTGAASSSRLEHVRAMVDLGVAYRRCGRQELADVALRGALDLASRGGMVRLAARCRAELHAGGARPRRDAVRGVGALTPSEHRIAVLAAQGLSNPEIAQQLYVTRRTVETHLTHVFQKLHVTSRADLAQQLAEPEPVGALGG